jgi:hypothetical protein
MRLRHEAATRPDRLQSPQASLCVAGALVCPRRDTHLNHMRGARLLTGQLVRRVDKRLTVREVSRDVVERADHDREPRRPTCTEMVGSAARSGWQGDADHRCSWSIWTAHQVCLRSGSCQNAGHGRTVVEVGRFVPFDRESWIDSVDRIGRIGAQHRIGRFCPVDCVGGIDIVRFLRGLGALLRFGALSSIALVVVEQRGRSRRTEGASPAHICRRQRGRACRALGSVQPQALEPPRRSEARTRSSS